MNSPKEIAQNYIATGVSKTKLPIPAMFALAVLAGMFIALAGAGSTVASAAVNSPSISRLLGAMVFPVGLVMVLIAGSELFTGNTLIIIPVLQKEAKITAMLRNWVVVYIGNFVGGILVAALVVYGGTPGIIKGDAVAVSMIGTAVSKVTMSFDDALFRGILCNFLVCIAVWISFAAKDVVGKVAGMYLPIMLFVLSGYEHSVANMYYIPAGLFAKGNGGYFWAAANGGVSVEGIAQLTWGTFFTGNLIPATLGNIIGGMVLVGAMYWFVYLRGNSDAPAKTTVSGKKK